MSDWTLSCCLAWYTVSILIQVSLFQKHLFLYHLTHSMTKYFSLNYEFSTWKFQAQNMLRTCCVHKLFFVLTFRTIYVHNMFWAWNFHVLNSWYNEQSVVILWVSWCKNRCFWQIFTCIYRNLKYLFNILTNYLILHDTQWISYALPTSDDPSAKLSVVNMIPMLRNWTSLTLHWTGKFLSEALIFASTNLQYDDRLFIELQVQYMKIPSSTLGRTCCVQKLFLTFRTIFVHMFCKKIASDKVCLYMIFFPRIIVCRVQIMM